MKTLVASVILFCILIGIIIGNVFYINHVTDRLHALASEIDIDSDESLVDALGDYWKKHKKYVSLSVSYKSLDEICDLVISIESAHKAGNASALDRNKKLLFDKLASVTRFEKISIETIF